MRPNGITLAQLEAACVACYAGTLVGAMTRLHLSDGQSGRNEALQGIAHLREALDKIEAALGAQVLTFPGREPGPGPEAA